jgi:hypothetical protein
MAGTGGMDRRLSYLKVICHAKDDVVINTIFASSTVFLPWL